MSTPVSHRILRQIPALPNRYIRRTRIIICCCFRSLPLLSSYPRSSSLCLMGPFALRSIVYWYQVRRQSTTFYKTRLYSSWLCGRETLRFAIQPLRTLYYGCDPPSLKTHFDRTCLLSPGLWDTGLDIGLIVLANKHQRDITFLNRRRCI